MGLDTATDTELRVNKRVHEGTYNIAVYKFI